MKNSIVLLCLLAMTQAVVGQDTSAEKEVIAVMDRYAKATAAKDAAYIQTVLAEDYSYSNPYGGKESRATIIDFIEQEKTRPTFKVNGFRSENVEVRIYANTAIVTSDWVMDSTSIKAHSGDPPHQDKGRNTAILVKAGGNWKLVHEHDSEQEHDKALMEKQVAALGRAYTDMIKRNAAAAIEQILADDYIVTDEEGTRLTKEQDLATYKGRAASLKIDTVEYKDQNVRMLTGSIAIDHSTIRFVGTRDGKPFDITERITTTWAFREGRWLIVADHFSILKPKAAK